MEVAIDLTREDIWQFDKFLNFRTRYGQIGVAASILVYPLVYLGFQWAISQALGESLLRFLIVTALWIPTHFWFWKRRVKNALSEKGSQVGNQTVGIASDRIFAKAALFEEFTLWQGVLEIAQNQDYIFVFTDIYKAYLIPKRAFSNTSEAKAFLDTAVSFWKVVQA